MKVNLMLLHNPRAVRTAYPDDLHEILNHAQAQISRDCLQQWRGIAPQPTPIYDLPDAAKRIGVGMVSVKDESQRSSLGSFKALGAPIALVRFLMREHPEWEMAAVFTGRYRDALREQTVISATDGNHGRALAAAAQDCGCRCVIVLHAHVSEEREAAISAYGAEIVRIQGNYDESVLEAARLAQANGWQVISDTSYEGYEEVPRDVMQGYATIAAEIIEAEEVSGETGEVLTPQEGGADQATALLSLEELIKNHIESTQKLREEIKQAREMFEDSFNNNPTYREHSERVKEVSKSKNCYRKCSKN